MQEAAKCKTSGNEATAADPVSCIQAEAHGSKTPTKTDGRAQTSEPPTAHHYCYCGRRIDCRALSSHWKFLHNNSSESIRRVQFAPG